MASSKPNRPATAAGKSEFCKQKPKPEKVGNVCENRSLSLRCLKLSSHGSWFLVLLARTAEPSGGFGVDHVFLTNRFC